jgi:hypothetical protein
MRVRGPSAGGYVGLESGREKVPDEKRRAQSQRRADEMLEGEPDALPRTGVVPLTGHLSPVLRAEDPEPESERANAGLAQLDDV